MIDWEAGYADLLVTDPEPGRQPRIADRSGRRLDLEILLAHASRGVFPTGKYPFYERVPKRIEPNVEYRRRLLRKAFEDEEYREAVRRACERDLLFWINTFCWTIDPIRWPNSPVRPFVTWRRQDEILDELADAVGVEDKTWLKSRDAGATHMVLYLFDWLFLTRPHQHFLCVSQKQDYVDSNDERALFRKLDFNHRHLPRWFLTPSDLERSKLHIRNLRLGSTIVGEATTSNVGTSARVTAMLFDEFGKVRPLADQRNAFAATQAITRSRFFVSTPMLGGDVFHELCRTKAHIDFHFTSHPLKRVGLYLARPGEAVQTSGNVRVEINDVGSVYEGPLDGDFWAARTALPASKCDARTFETRLATAHVLTYPFIKDGELRSPWYDAEEERTTFDWLMDQEVNMRFVGAGLRAFPERMVSQIERADAREPWLVTEFDYDPITCEPFGIRDTSLTAQEAKGEHKIGKGERAGRLRLWCALTPDLEPPPGLYALGCDCSTGEGASESVIAIGNAETGEKVAEWACAHTPDDEFPKLAIALARWFHKAYLVWDALGPPGMKFTRCVKDSGYENIYRRGNDPTVKTQSNRDGEIIGWPCSKDQKILVLVALGHMLGRSTESGFYVERSRDTIRQLREFIVEQNGCFTHQSVLAEHEQDSRHGDRVIATAIMAVKGLAYLRKNQPRARADADPLTGPVLPNSFQGRRAARLASRHRRRLSDEYAEEGLGG